jgi:hypothetical protein
MPSSTLYELNGPLNGNQGDLEKVLISFKGNGRSSERNAFESTLHGHIGSLRSLQRIEGGVHSGPHLT